MVLHIAPCRVQQTLGRTHAHTHTHTHTHTLAHRLIDDTAVLELTNAPSGRSIERLALEGRRQERDGAINSESKLYSQTRLY